MSDVSTTRRTLLKGAALGMAGVAFPVFSAGLMAPSEGNQRPVEIMSWVLITPDNHVVLRITQSEIGQGVMTTLSQLLAEELAIDWSQVRTEFFDPALNHARGNVYGWTCTESSWSADRLFIPLRTAGAQIRRLLVEEASQQLGVPAEQLTAESGVIGDGKRSRTYAELATGAAQRKPVDPARIVLKPREQFRYVGHSVPRLDVPGKVDGSAVFGIDITLPGMLFAAIRQSPVFGGKLRRFDRDAVAGRPGVVAVVDVRGGSSGLNGPPEDGGEIYPMDDAVAVVADSWWRAHTALAALPIEWDEGAAASVSSESIVARFRELLDEEQPVTRETGDVEAGFSTAANVIEADYAYPFMDALPLEPLNCTARVDDDGVEVWAPTQFAQDGLRLAAEVAGVPIERARLHLTLIGGGFGRRCQNEYVSQAVQIAMAVRGRPVKLIWSREECFARGYYPPLTLARLKGGVDEQGRITALRCRVISGRAPDQSYGTNRSPLWVPHQRFEYRRVETPPPFGWMRGVGFTQYVWMLQSFFDELARSAGRDPVLLYRELLDESRIPASTAQRPIEVQRVRKLRTVLDRAVSISGWHDARAAGSGRGVAVSDFSYWPDYHTGATAAVAEVTLPAPDLVRVERVTVAADCGQVINPDVVRAQFEGQIAWAMTTAMFGQITLQAGRVLETNFHMHDVARLAAIPKHIDIQLEDGDGHPAGVGEDAVPIVMTALLNAISAAGGPRVRSLPISRHGLRFG